MTNDKLIKGIMNYSKYGALSPMMVMQALNYYVDMIIEDEAQILKKDAEDTANGKNSIINMQAWIAVAKEIREKLDNNL